MTVPILLPIATQFGIDPIHFEIILIANMGIGLFLPPVGLGVFCRAQYWKDHGWRGCQTSSSLPEH
jgi:C4-dicarboxylate transporter DctM subunit